MARSKGRLAQRVIGLGSVSAVVALGSAVLSASPAVADTVTCGQTITQSTTLSADVGPCPGDGIILGADNITVNLGGHTISGVAAMGNGSAGARLGGRTGVIVKKGTITGFDAGVVIDGGSHNTIRGLSIHDNIGQLDMGGDFGDGVAIGVGAPSASNTVRDNTITHNGPFEGVGVFRAASTGNRILHNVINHNNVMTTQFGEDLHITEDFGVNLGSGIEGSNRTTISYNTIDDNGAMGIEACSFNGNPCVTTDNLMSGNDITRNGFIFPDEHVGALDGAIRIVDIAQTGSPRDSSVSTRDRVQGNRVVGNALGGIFVTSRNNQILYNVATGNDPNHDSLIFDLEDISNGQAPNIAPCDHNQWYGNVWGYYEDDPATGFGSFYPDCVTTGGHGPRPGPLSQANQANSAASAMPALSSAEQQAVSAAPVHRGP